MGKLTSVAQRIAEAKAKMDAEADKLADKLDVLNAKAPDAFSRAHGIIDSSNADLDGMDADLRQLSNLPPD